ATWNGVDRLCVAPAFEPGAMKPVSVVSVESTPQLVGLNRKPCLLIATLMLRRRSGTPCWIRGSVVVAVTRAVIGSMFSIERVTPLRRLNGPATAGTAIDRPNGAPL